MWTKRSAWTLALLLILATGIACAAVSPREALEAVINGDARLTSVADGRETALEDLVDSTFETAMIFRDVAWVDLDGDGIEEAALALYANDDPFGFELLRYSEGIVYGYALTYRELMALKTDGTFFYSSGAQDNGIGVIAFTKDAYAIIPLSSCESTDDGGISYIVDGTNAAQDAYQNAIDAQQSKENVAWHSLVGGDELSF